MRLIITIAIISGFNIFVYYEIGYWMVGIFTKSFLIFNICSVLVLYADIKTIGKNEMFKMSKILILL